MMPHRRSIFAVLLGFVAGGRAVAAEPAVPALPEAVMPLTRGGGPGLGVVSDNFGWAEIPTIMYHRGNYIPRAVFEKTVRERVIFAMEITAHLGDLPLSAEHQQAPFAEPGSAPPDPLPPPSPPDAVLPLTIRRAGRLGVRVPSRGEK